MATSTPKQLSEQLAAVQKEAVEAAKAKLQTLLTNLPDLEEAGIPSEPGSYLTRVRSTISTWIAEADTLAGRLAPVPAAPDA